MASLIPQVYHRVELPFTPDAASAARLQFRHFAPRLADQTLDEALVMVSELVTNAVQHGQPAITLQFWLNTDCITVAVFDEGDAPGSLIFPSPPTDQPRGRGLLIVNALATRWGVHRTDDPAGKPSGKSVWFELARAPVPA